MELWIDRVHSARLLDVFYRDLYGKKTIDADISAYKKADYCHCDKNLDEDFEKPLEWFKCVIRNNFAKKDGVADSSHLGSFVTHIPESHCKENK